jgi:uncharacterized repeat protein (TIGR02543 family)
MTIFSGKRKSILLFCLAVMLICNYCIPSSVWADSYTVRDGNGQVSISIGTVLHAGDTLDFEEYIDEVTQKSEYGYRINYIFADGSVSSDEAFASMGEGNTVDVRSYDGDFSDRFEGWYVSDVDKEMTADDGVFIFVIDLEPVIRFNISYETYGGRNADDNPGTYRFGIGVDGFQDAEKDGYSFTGWFLDEELTEKITGISGNESGDMTLYAGFEIATYDIKYELDGGDNSEDNPSQYTYGTTIDSIEDAVKEGYTFEGWFLDPDFETGFTGITAETFGDITLYARFEEIKDGDDDEDPADQDAQDGDDTDSPEDGDGQDTGSDDQDGQEDGYTDPGDQQDDADDAFDDQNDSINDNDDMIDGSGDNGSDDIVDESGDNGSDDMIDGTGDKDDDITHDASADDKDKEPDDRNDAAETGGQGENIDIATAQDASHAAVVPERGNDDKPFDPARAEASTGDKTPIKLCIALLGVSALMIVFLLIKKKSKDDSEDKEEKTE